MADTVLFGPFIGEFGWEIAYWQGWVKRMCKTTFAGHHRIAMSAPGRQVLYPDVDDFWPLPDEWVARRYSAGHYILDGWVQGRPVPRDRVRYRQLGLVTRWRFEEKELPPDAREHERNAEALLASFDERLPAGTTVIAPWRWNHVAGLSFGVDYELCEDGPAFRFQGIPVGEQVLEPLRPTARGVEALNALVPADARLLAVIPRARPLRRTDRNWTEERYVKLIAAIQRRHPDLTIAVIGEPGGSHFVGGVPDGCVDLVNVAADVRTDTQIAALGRSVLATGASSGGTLLPMHSGTPTVMWSYEGDRHRTIEANVLGVPLVFHSDPSPRVEHVAALIDGVLAGDLPPGGKADWNTLASVGVNPWSRWRLNRL